MSFSKWEWYVNLSAAASEKRYAWEIKYGGDKTIYKQWESKAKSVGRWKLKVSVH